jgi:hypothetical protein
MSSAVLCRRVRQVKGVDRGGVYTAAVLVTSAILKAAVEKSEKEGCTVGIDGGTVLIALASAENALVVVELISTLEPLPGGVRLPSVVLGGRPPDESPNDGHHQQMTVLASIPRTFETNRLEWLEMNRRYVN